MKVHSGVGDVDVSNCMDSTVKVHPGVSVVDVSDC